MGTCVLEHYERAVLLLAVCHVAGYDYWIEETKRTMPGASPQCLRCAGSSGTSLLAASCTCEVLRPAQLGCPVQLQHLQRLSSHLIAHVNALQGRPHGGGGR